MTYASLLHGIRARKGLILLVGEVGTGKTLLIRKLLDQIHGEATATAFVFNPRMSAAEFLDFALSDFGIKHDFKDRVRTLATLQEWLLGRNLRGQKSVLIVDEAQHLSAEAFEVVRALSSLETPTENPLQIVLSGQPEIENTLSQPGMRPFTQRIGLRLRTCLLRPAETLQYIAHRLRIAGGNVETVFTPEAGMAVSWSSAGIPRLINLICEHALISGYADQRKPIGAGTIWKIAREFNLRVATWAEAALADEVSGPIESGALTRRIPEITEPASALPQAAPIRVSPGPHKPHMPMGARRHAGTSAEVPITAQGGEGVKSVASRTPLPMETPPGIPEVISQPNEGQVSPRVAVQPFRDIQPEEIPTPWSKQIPVATQAPSAMPRGTVTASGASNLSGEITGAQSAGGEGAKESPAGRPAIAAKSAAVAQRSAEGTNVAPRQAQQPISQKMRAAGPGLAHINYVPSPPARERPGVLQWTTLALISMGVVLGSYYLIGGRLLMRTRGGEPPNSTSKALTSEKPPGDNLAGLPTPTPSGGTGVTGQEQAPPQQAASVPGGKAKQVTAIPAKSAREQLPSASPRLVSRLASPSSEVQGPRKQASVGTSPPLPPPAPGRLSVTSNVPGASITVDGRSDPSWTAPHLFADLSPGVHTVVVAKQGYKEAQQSVTVDGGGETSVNATLAPPRGEIDISTHPPEAEVLIDGKSYGSGPVRAKVDAGQHTFLVRQAGREPVEGSFVVQDQAVVQRTIDLPLKPITQPVMNIAVTTNPPSATVYADGAAMSGKTPTSFHLSPGHHTLIIFAAGYRPLRREIDVPEDRVLSVNATLSGQ